ncbi:MAG TPA: hypothetical protein VMU14_20900 [Acidimicrobiales bacterium]|nr:hypothetical protein [Acidimicrobiales bacterium]
MGLIKTWKAAKALGNAAGTGTSAQPRQQRATGMARGFAAVMGQMAAPLVAACGPNRGAPLPGTEPEVLVAVSSGAVGAVDEGVAAVRARDAAFDPSVLATFAGQVFAAIASVWGSGDPGQVRALMSDDLWEPLAASLTSGLGAALGTILAHLAAEPTLRNVWAGSAYDSAHVGLAVRVDLPPEQLAEVPGEFTHWGEDWLLQRSVVPGDAPMAQPETCPSCGAPTVLDPDGCCAHCRQPVPVVTAGWLVTCIRAHNPAVDLMQAKIVADIQQNPQVLAMMPDELVRALPADVVTGVDPARAAALRMRV